MEGVWMRWGLVATCEWLVPTSPHTMGRRGYPPCNSCAMGIQWYLELATVSWELGAVFAILYGGIVTYTRDEFNRASVRPWRISAVYKSNCSRISGDPGCSTHPRLLSCYYRCFPNRWIFSQNIVSQKHNNLIFLLGVETQCNECNWETFTIIIKPLLLLC